MITLTAMSVCNTYSLLHPEKHQLLSFYMFDIVGSAGRAEPFNPPPPLLAAARGVADDLQQTLADSKSICWTPPADPAGVERFCSRLRLDFSIFRCFFLPIKNSSKIRPLKHTSQTTSQQLKIRIPDRPELDLRIIS